MCDEKDKQYSFEEFRMFYESAEKMTDRRLSENNWNYSVCVALLLAIAHIFNWSRTNFQYCHLGLALGGLLSVMAVFFCIHWLIQIRDFKYLNRAKFQVLEDMAPRLGFGQDNMVSAEPFKNEWNIMNRNKELGFLKGEIQVLKSSRMELFIPQAFMFIFILMSLFALLQILLHWQMFIEAIKCFMEYWPPAELKGGGLP